LFLEDLNEHYHSIHGALQEAKHVFFKMGWDLFLEQKEIKILEIGLGTGLNATLALEKSLEESKSLIYHSIEKFPVPLEITKDLNYNELLSKDVFQWIHEVNWEDQNYYKEGNIQFQKFNTDIFTFESNQSYDIVFFDAFAPNKQAEMWEEEVMIKMYDLLKNGGLLTTYCCQGKVKRTLQKVGFEVQKVQGPPGKREMINAWKR
jgi:tRNA U34 5-methylaminomethyl-2-thiouridine-forming methyltransferase MnmC